jgi:hypothetical protein
MYWHINRPRRTAGTETQQLAPLEHSVGFAGQAFDALPGYCCFPETACIPEAMLLVLSTNTEM